MSEFKMWLEELEKKNFYPYVRAAWRGIFQYVFYALCFAQFRLQFWGSFVVDSYVQNLRFRDVWLALFLVLFAFLILNSTLFTFSVFDPVSRKIFMKSTTREKDAEDIDGIREALVASRSFWVEFLTPILLCFLFPVWYGYENVVDLIPFAGKLPSFVHRLILTLIFAATSFTLSVTAHSAAQKHWIEKAKAKLQDRGYVATEQINRTAYTLPKFIFRLLLLFSLYSLGGMLLVSLVGPAWSLVKIVWMFLREFVFLILIALIVGLVVLRVVWKRLRFYTRLKRLCKQYGFRIRSHRGWFSSIILPGKSYQIAVEANGKTYYCRMIASYRRLNRMQFFSDGSFFSVFSMHMPTPAVAVTSRFAMGAVYIDRSHVDEREIFKIKIKGRYAFDCEEKGRKILILNPVPRRVILGTDTHKEADNGDRIGEYSVYTGGAFIRALKNDAVVEKN